MTTLEVYELVLDTLAAFGTFGAVVISLWLSRPNKPRFSIKGVQSRMDLRFDEGKKRMVREHYLLVKIENLRDVQMEVFGASINVDTNMYGVTLRGTFIPGLNTYEIKAPINQKYFSYDLGERQKIICKVTSSFGEKMWRLKKKEKDVFHQHVSMVRASSSQAL